MSSGRKHPEGDGALLRAALDISEAVAGSRTAAELGQLVMNAVDRLVECDFGSILSAAPGQEWTLEGAKEDNRVIQQNQWRYAQEMSPDELGQLGTRFSRDTEIFVPNRRDRMSVYQEFLRPNRQAGFLARYWVMDGRLWGIGMSRATPGFTERERERLDAAFPLLKAALRAGAWRAEVEGRGLRPGEGGPWSLTEAEDRTMSLVVRGLTNKEVAGLLGVSPNTVRNTLARVFEKVGVSRRSELAFLARHHTDEARGDRRPFERTADGLTTVPRRP
jgi:DNA-binding CsgD family transcriptional regulator